MLFIRSFFITVLALFININFSHAEKIKTIHDNTLVIKITALINANSGLPADSNVIQTVKILTPHEQLAKICDTPELSLAGNNTRLTGNKSVIAQCGTRRKFIQIKVQANGTWWSTHRTIKPGNLINDDDLVSRSGSLERLPAGLIFNKANIIGRTATRTINRGQPIVANQLRLPWAIVSGQEVEIYTRGEGFQIRSKGKALDSGAVNKLLRVSTRSGQVITGIVTADGKVNVNLKE